MEATEKAMAEILVRLVKLEAAVFGARKPHISEKPNKTHTYTGPTGGVRLLFDEGFFKQKRSVEEVHQALEKRDYLYIKDVVRNSLNRMASPSGPLVAIKGKAGKEYAIRK